MPGLSITFNQKDLKTFNDATKLIQDRLKTIYLDTLADFILDEATRLLTSGELQLKGPTGRLTKSVEIDRISENSREFGFTAVSSEGYPYPQVVEWGRASGKAPPFKPIFEWVKRAGLGTGKEQKSIAYAIINKIKKRGIKGTGFFRKAIEIAKNNEKKIEKIAFDQLEKELKSV